MRRFNSMSKKKFDSAPYEAVNDALKKQGHPPIPYPANQSMRGALMSEPKRKLKSE